MFKVVNTTCKGRLVALELRLHTGQITPTVRQHLKGHAHILRVIAGNHPGKVFVLTDIPSYAKKSTSRSAFVADLNQLARAAA
jgi:hypothetical protein